MTRFQIGVAAGLIAVCGCSSNAVQLPTDSSASAPILRRTDGGNVGQTPATSLERDKNSVEPIDLSDVVAESENATTNGRSRAPRFFDGRPSEEHVGPIILSESAAAALRQMIRETPISFDLKWLEKSEPLGVFECDGTFYELHGDLLVSEGQQKKVWTNRRLVTLHKCMGENPATLEGVSKAIEEFGR